MSEQKLPASIEEMTDILDIEGIAAGALGSWLNLLIITVTAMAVVCLLWRLARWIKRRFFPSDKDLTPVERARKALAKLKSRDHIGKNEWAPYYFALSEIAKRFVTEQFGVDVADRTTEEISRLKSELSRCLGADRWERWQAFLTRGDQAKFARLPATPQEAWRDFDFVEQLLLIPSPRDSVAGQVAMATVKT